MPKTSRTVGKLRDALLGVQSELSLPQLIALLTIGEEPGLSVNELAGRLGIPQQSASRHVSALLGRYQILDSSKAPVAYIDQSISETDPRKRALFLNSDGHAMIASIQRHFA